MFNFNDDLYTIDNVQYTKAKYAVRKRIFSEHEAQIKPAAHVLDVSDPEPRKPMLATTMRLYPMLPVRVVKQLLRGECSVRVDNAKNAIVRFNGSGATRCFA